MIGSQICIEFNHQYLKKQSFSDHIFVADYTEQTKLLPVKRSVEFFCPNHPIDITYFTIKNDPNITVDGIEFDNLSFVRSGKTLTQCEAVFFPNISTNNSWILFCELKYSSKPYRNGNNLNKALKQLFRTRYYYVQQSIISITNTSYLIASLPLQSEPFPNFVITPTKLVNLKRKKNIVLRLQNKVEIIDDKLIKV
jgi:hypothetical protein